MKYKNPWKTLSSRDVYDNPWIYVKEDRVVHPNGDKGIYGKIHFKNKAVGILPLFENGDTLLVGQFRYVLEKYSWEIPEGGCPEGEEPLEAAKRELLEETGYQAGEWVSLFTADLSNSVTDERCFGFLAKNLEKVATPNPDPSEELELKRISFKELLAMIDAGEVTDAVTIMTAYKTDRWRQEGRLSI